MRTIITILLGFILCLHSTFSHAQAESPSETPSTPTPEKATKVNTNDAKLRGHNLALSGYIAMPTGVVMVVGGVLMVFDSVVGDLSNAFLNQGDSLDGMPVGGLMLTGTGFLTYVYGKNVMPVASHIMYSDAQARGIDIRKTRVLLADGLMITGVLLKLNKAGRPNSEGMSGGGLLSGLGVIAHVFAQQKVINQYNASKYKSKTSLNLSKKSFSVHFVPTGNGAALIGQF